jgi:group I intron endonuclease
MALNISKATAKKRSRPKMFSLYKATNLINGKCYIGQTIEYVSVRKSKHLYEVFKKETSCYFHNALRKYGIDNFKWETIYQCNDKLMLNLMETFKIMVNHSHRSENGYNLTWGGDCCSGFKLSEATKQKISKNRKGKGTGNANGMKNPENKNKISDIRTGMKFSKKHCDNIGKSKRKYTNQEMSIILEKIKNLRNTGMSYAKISEIIGEKQTTIILWKNKYITRGIGLCHL